MRDTALDIADYAARIAVPLSGDPSRSLLTSTGLVVATGYMRVVVGGRGPYVEFDDPQVVMASIERAQAPHYYYDEWRTRDAARVKLYHQMATVGYADYLVRMWYVSPTLLFLPGGRPLMGPPVPPAAGPEPRSIFD